MAGTIHAQEQPPANVHWAYSAYFGTGWYSVDGDRDVLIFRLTPRWELQKPDLEEGRRRYGRVLKAGEDAWTYWARVKSRVTRHSSPDSNWYLLSQLGFVGYTPNEGRDDSFWPAMLGIETNHPFFGRSRDDSKWRMHWNLSYTYFGSDVFFSRTESVSQDISDQWEIGTAISRRDAPVEIWLLLFDRLGIGYRSSSNGALSGVTFFFRSAFEE